MASKKGDPGLFVHTVGGLDPRLGGASRIVSKLTASLAADGKHRIVLLSQGKKGERVVPISGHQIERRIGLTDTRSALVLGYPLRKVLHELIAEQCPSLLHDHGIWMPSNHYVAAAARKRGIPLVIHPHGMLEPWALQHRAWKKRIVLRLYQQQDLETATLFFATADQEADSIRRLGFKQPIAVIPNGVEIDLYHSDGSGRSGVAGGYRIVLFLGRIHPIKGLINLIEAWGKLRPMGWRLRLAGPDEGGHLAEIMQIVRTLGLETTVEYVGEVEGDVKERLFEQADLFVLPSFSENFGVVVAEALAHGLPVITTRGTPWEGLLRHGCGWWIDPTVDALSETMRQAMKMDHLALSSMREKARTYALEFDWGPIAHQTMEVYRWILGQGERPNCVRTAQGMRE